MSTIGTAGTQQNVCTRIFCEAKEVDDHQVEVRYLGFNGNPSGIVEVLQKEEFLKDFTYYSGAHREKDDLKNRTLEKHIAMADDHLKKKEYFAAEYEYNNALRIDEENVRGNFGKGLSLVERGEEEKARRWIQTALKANPNLQEASDFLNRLARSQSKDAGNQVVEKN